jgi:hypothetical protein
MGSVAIQASFGKKQRIYNGLEGVSDDLVDKPLQEHYIIAKVRTVRITKEIEGEGVEVPTVALSHIEVMLSEKEEAAARKLFETAAKARLGELPQQPLPLHGEDPDPDDVD